MKKFLLSLSAALIVCSCQSEYKAYLDRIENSYRQCEECITDEEYNALELPGAEGIPQNCSREETMDILEKHFEFHELLKVKRYIINEIRYRIDDYGTVISKDEMRDLTRKCMAQVSKKQKENTRTLAAGASTFSDYTKHLSSLASMDYYGLKKDLDNNPEVQKLIKDFIDSCCIGIESSAAHHRKVRKDFFCKQVCS